MPDPNTPAARFLALRNKVFTSQTALADATAEAAQRLGGDLKGIDRTNISAWENGRGEPSKRSLTVVAAAYNVSRGLLRQYLEGEVSLHTVLRRRKAGQVPPLVQPAEGV